MDCNQVFVDGYGCTCDSETVIFCFDKTTGQCNWSCSGHCFKRLPLQTVATQTESTAPSFPTLQQKTSTLTHYGTKGIETGMDDVNENQKDVSLVTNAVCRQEMKGDVGSRNTISAAVSHTSLQSVHQAETSNPSKDALVSHEACEVQNVVGDEIQGQSLFDDLDDKNDTLANGKDMSVHSADVTSEDTFDLSGNIHMDAIPDDDTDAEYQTNATPSDSDDDNHVDVESDAECRLYSVDIPDLPTKVRKTKKNGKAKSKVGAPREVFPCTYCTRKCTTKSTYEKHIEWHTRSKETKCSICGKEFSQPGYLINHQKQHQQAKEVGREVSGGTDAGVKTTKVAECRYCGKLMKAKRLSGHEQTHAPKEKPDMSCAYCGKNFKCRGDFIRHERTHTKERPFKCNQCESAFSSTKELTIHIRRHLGDKRYKCDHCGKAFVRKCNLDEHLRTHTGARPYKCNYCDKAFGFKNVLKVHLMRHTGVRPHVCEYCDKGFAKKAFLDKHIISHYE